MATAKGQRQAAVYNANLFNNNQAGTTDTLQTLADRSLGALYEGRDNANSALTTGANNALSSLGTNYDAARGALNDNFGQARTDLQTGINGLDTWANSGRQANTAYADFLGLNGGAGSQAQTDALAAFRNATGYQDILNQTSDAALRKASVVGGLGGNQLDELGRIGGQLANQSAQTYLGNLGTLSGQGLTAAQSQQAGYNNLANLGVQQGTSLAGTYTDQGAKEAGIQTALGSSLAGVAQNAGLQNAGIYTGLGNSLNQLGQYTTTGITNGITEQGKASDAAKQANQQTAINLGTTALNAISSLAGGPSGIMSSIKNIGTGGLNYY